MRRSAYAAGIEYASLVEQLGTLHEERSLLIVPDLVGRQVQYMVIRLHLTEIGYQRCIKGEALGQADFEVESPVI